MPYPKTYGLFLLLLLLLTALSTAASDTLQVVKNKRKGKVVIIQTIDKQSRAKISREKWINQQRQYFVRYNSDGKIIYSINKKGKERNHKPCNCAR
jgi:hypothetical protein